MPTTVAGPGYRGASPEGIHPHGWLPPQFLALGVQSRHTTVMRRSRLAWWDPGGQRTPFGLAWHTGQEIFISLYAGTRLVVPRPVRWSSSPRAFLAFAAASRSFTIGMIRSWWPWSRETASPPGSPGSVQSWLAFAPQRGAASANQASRSSAGSTVLRRGRRRRRPAGRPGRGPVAPLAQPERSRRTGRRPAPPLPPSLVPTASEPEPEPASEEKPSSSPWPGRRAIGSPSAPVPSTPPFTHCRPPDTASGPWPGNSA